MAVGTQGSEAQINAQVTSLALQLRNLCTVIRDFSTYVNTLGATGLTAMGYSAQDAATVQTLVSYLNTFPLVYDGVQFQGTTASNGIQFDFDNALSQVWGGQ